MWRTDPGGSPAPYRRATVKAGDLMEECGSDVHEIAQRATEVLTAGVKAVNADAAAAAGECQAAAAEFLAGYFRLFAFGDPDDPPAARDDVIPLEWPDADDADGV